MAVEQIFPEVPRIEITPLTEEQLCKPGAVKLIYKQLTELEVKHAGLQTELTAERTRNETLVVRAHSSENNCAVLQERLRSTGRRGTIARLIEFVITILLAYVIDSARSRAWTNFAVFLILSIVLAFAVYFIDRAADGDQGAKT